MSWKDERKLRLKGLGTFKISGGERIKCYSDRERDEVVSGVIQWYSWKDKQIEIRGDDGRLYLLELSRDPDTRSWRYRVNDITDSIDAS